MYYISQYIAEFSTFIEWNNKIGGGRIGCFSGSYRNGWHHPCRLTVMGKDAQIIIGSGGKMSGVNIFARSKITIGNSFEIAAGTIIIDNNGHPTYSYDRTKGFDTPKPITIGNNVWIGLNCIILKGTTIGDNSIVSAGSVVKGTFPPYSLICGNPARIVKALNPCRFR